jgi:hypothetical protein
VLPGVSSTFHVPGTLTINGVDCDGIGYGDLREGTEVTLTDESGKVLAVGELARTGACSFTFSLDAPTGKKFYGVTISHRGTVHYTEDELRHGLQLSIG